jgi:hypothetical protein
MAIVRARNCSNSNSRLLAIRRFASPAIAVAVAAAMNGAMKHERPFDVDLYGAERPQFSSRTQPAQNQSMSRGAYGCN